jgi:hypothetical protein
VGKPPGSTSAGNVVSGADSPDAIADRLQWIVAGIGICHHQRLSRSHGDVEMQTDDLANLTLPARLAAMEALWDSLSHDPLHNPSPAWHAEVLAQRRLEMAQAVPCEETKRRLRSLADARQT